MMLLPLPTKKYKTGREVVNWSAIGKGSTFPINSTQEIEVISNENMVKISKNGNARKERRLTVKLKGFKEVIEVGIESFKKTTFVKRLLKISKTHETYLLVPFETLRVTDGFGMLIEDIYADVLRTEFRNCNSMKELKAVYKKWSKKLHPDATPTPTPYTQSNFELLHQCFRYYRELRITLVDSCRACGIDMEY